MTPPASEERITGSSSLKDKLKQSLCLSCCFTTRRQSVQSPNDKIKSSLIVKASSTWIKARAHELPELCVRLFSRIGGDKHHGHRHSAADFRYDPLSYSLNFEASRRVDDSDFCSRLPPTPTSKPLPEKQLPLELERV